jgi:hypothetical protein
MSMGMVSRYTSKSGKAAPTGSRALWTCPRCDAQLLVPNGYHSCGRFDLEALFRRAEPSVRALFDDLSVMVHDAGKVKMIPQKSRAVFMNRLRFINVQVRRSNLIVGFILSRRPTSNRFFRVDTFSPPSHAAYLRIQTAAELDAEVRQWIREAHDAGVERHTGPRSGGMMVKAR